MNLTLPTLFIGQNLTYIKELPSTNAYALQLIAAENPPEGSIVMAGYQTAGRGQMGTNWRSEADKNLLISLILKPSFLALGDSFYLSKIAALACRETIAHFCPDAEVLIKWPNDLLLNRKKVAGILIENQLDNLKIAYSVLGIGINLNQFLFPEVLRETATSLWLQLGREVEPGECLTHLAVSLEKYYLKLKQSQLPAIDSEYLRYLYAYQEVVRVEIGGESLETYIAGVQKDGKIALQFGDKLRFFDIKEVKFVI